MILVGNKGFEVVELSGMADCVWGYFGMCF